MINKATLLTDAVAGMFGFGSSAVPNDMFNVLTHAGDLHVWKRTQDGVVDYPVSPNRNAYQEGTVDDTTIEYMGQVGNKARIVTGSYVGTGTYGKSNPNTLEFDSKPAIVIVYVANSVNGVAVFYPFNLSPNIASSSPNAWCRMSRNLAYDCDVKYASFSGTTLTWYNLLTSPGSGPDNQQNHSGLTYNYIAIL